MAADTGPIGGNLSHEFIILADTGESKIFTDKRIFDLTSDGTDLEKSSLEQMRKKYEQFYSVTDEKFNKEEFEKMVNEENRLITKGIEVGHIFYFGDKYSKAMDAAVDLPGGKKDFVKMGSYGIGVSRLVGAIIEAKYDEKNEIMKWPLSVAPYDIALIPMINKNDTSTLEKANNINSTLKFNTKQIVSKKTIISANMQISNSISTTSSYSNTSGYSLPSNRDLDLNLLLLSIVHLLLVN